MDATSGKQLEEIRDSFQHFDSDGNGLIDFKEFQQLLKTLSPEATLQQTGEGFSMIDTNCDGYIDLDEFVVWWQSVWWEY